MVGGRAVGGRSGPPVVRGTAGVRARPRGPCRATGPTRSRTGGFTRGASCLRPSSTPHPLRTEPHPTGVDGLDSPAPVRSKRESRVPDHRLPTTTEGARIGEVGLGGKRPVLGTEIQSGPVPLFPSDGGGVPETPMCVSVTKDVGGVPLRRWGVSGDLPRTGVPRPPVLCLYWGCGGFGLAFRRHFHLSRGSRAPPPSHLTVLGVRPDLPSHLVLGCPSGYPELPPVSTLRSADPFLSHADRPVFVPVCHVDSDALPTARAPAGPSLTFRPQAPSDADPEPQCTCVCRRLRDVTATLRSYPHPLPTVGPNTSSSSYHDTGTLVGGLRVTGKDGVGRAVGRRGGSGRVSSGSAVA